MNPGEIDSKVIARRAFWISQMMESLNDLHLEEKTAFLADRHKIAAAESYLRRALEALFDIGRHILAKRFACPATEYTSTMRLLLKNFMRFAFTTSMRSNSWLISWCIGQENTRRRQTK
jgi:uncharacterized protein YutE (UPF0331/DUF86 family)